MRLRHTLAGGACRDLGRLGAAGFAFEVGAQEVRSELQTAHLSFPLTDEQTQASRFSSTCLLNKGGSLGEPDSLLFTLGWPDRCSGVQNI